MKNACTMSSYTVSVQMFIAPVLQNAIHVKQLANRQVNSTPDYEAQAAVE